MADSFEITKFAGAVLAALLLIFLPKALLKISGEGEHEAAAGYVLPAAQTAAAPAPATGGGAAPAAFDPAAVVAMVAKANPANAAAGTFKKCAGCHSYDKASTSKAGPNLWNIVGRKRASREDFPGYSDAMKAKGGEWTYLDLASFVHSPKTFVPGTKMLFQGVAEPAELADLIAYLRTLADTPPPLP